MSRAVISRWAALVLALGLAAYGTPARAADGDSAGTPPVTTPAPASHNEVHRGALGFDSFDAPFGMRYWLTDRLGLDLGVGYDHHVIPEAGNDLALNTYTGEIGVPWALKTWPRASLLVRPGFQYTKEDNYDINYDTLLPYTYKTDIINFTLDLEAELFLAPTVSISAASGFAYVRRLDSFTDAKPEIEYGLAATNFTSLGFHVYFF